MKKPGIINVEVDMVPLIDIISLLLMFLIVVGDTTANSSNIKMKLPVADQAKRENGWHGWEEMGRIVIQIKPPASEATGKYEAVFNGARHAIADDAGASLKSHLQKYVNAELEHDRARLVSPENTVNIPVKLRIPEDCPMAQAECVLSTLAAVRLLDVEYAACRK